MLLRKGPRQRPGVLPQMIDMHCHILPGVDDGIQSLNDAVAVAKLASQGGIDTICASPHFPYRKMSDSFSDLVAAHRLLQNQIQQDAIPIRLLLWAEMLITPELPEQLKSNPQIAIGGKKRYFLMELPFGELPIYTESVIFQLMAAGYTPVIAHPERQFNIQKNPQLLYDLIAKGVLTQCNIGSLSARYGRASQKCVRTLIAAQAAHIFASDLHAVPSKQVHPLSEGFDQLKDLAGEQQALNMVKGVPAQIIAGENISVATPKQPKKRSWFSFGR